MAEFISQSEPVTPPSIDVTKPQQKTDPHLYMSNERNMYQTLLTGCVILVLSIYLPLVLPSDSSKWAAVALCITAIATLFMGLYTFKRNIDAFESNEQDYIDWNKSSTIMYSIGSVLLITSSMVLYELYWNANGKKSTDSSPIDLDDTKSVGSVFSAGSRRSSKGSRS